MSWSQLPTPSPQPMPGGEAPWPTGARILFTSPNNGSLFGPFLARTLDGGLTWRAVTLPTSDPVTDVFAFNSSTWALTNCDSGTPCPTRLWKAATATGSFQLANPQPASRGNMSAYSRAVTLGPRMILLSPFAEQPTLAVTTDGNSWTQLPSPCAGPDHQQLGASPTGSLIAVCWSAVGGGWGPKGAWGSVDGGTHWTLRSKSADFDNTRPVVGEITEHGYPSDIAMPASLDAWMAMDRNDLYETHDGGITWSASAVPGQFGGDAGGSEQVLFVDPQHGWALGAGGLFRTTDGRQWSKSNILGPVPGFPG